MTDPFSVSAGVVGVVSLGLTVCQGLTSYYGAWKAYDDEIGDFMTKVEGLQDILEVLSGFISEGQELELPTYQYRRLVSLQITPCQQACRRLETILSKLTLNDSSPFVRKHDWLRLKRATYPFKKDTLATISQTVSDLQYNLGLALQLLNSALLAQQQKQLQEVASKTTCIDIRTTKILQVVDEKTGPSSSRAIVHQRATNNPDIYPIVEPNKVNDLCRQQALINTICRKRQRLIPSQAELISRYCSCNKRYFYSSLLTFSAFVGHQANCPLYVAGQKTIGIAARYTFCNRLLRISANLMMAFTQGAGALSIHPMLQVHSVVADDFPAFKLLDRIDYKAGALEPHHQLNTIQQTLLRMLYEKKVAPTDRLADGRTLLHKLAYHVLSLDFQYDALFGDILQGFVRALIQAGVPVAEPDVDGKMALDIFILRLSLSRIIGDHGLAIGVDMLQYLLRSGGCLRPLDNKGVTYQATSLIRNLVFHNSFEDINIPPIEMAIITRSEEALHHCLSQINHDSCSDSTPRPTFATLLLESLGWVPGMLLLLESALPREPDSVANCLSEPYLWNEAECALLLLKFRPSISLGNLRAAVCCGDTDVLKTTISLLASQRQELQELALRCLPDQALRLLKIPEHGLLDTRAGMVYEALKQHGVEVGVEPDDYIYSVYGAIRSDIAAAELLYEAGFTNLQQRGKYGNPPLAHLRVYYEATYVDLANLAHWMISRGASLYQPSIGEYPAIFGLAQSFGSNLWGFAFSYRNSEFQRWADKLREQLQSANIDGTRLVATILSDETRDDCQCACSGGGCSPVTRLLRPFHRHGSQIPLNLAPERIGEFQEIIYEVSMVNASKPTALTTIRCLTFEALEITHTCHRIYGGKPTDPEDIQEIHDEESTLIDQLNDLMVEFDTKYDELGVGVKQFLVGYWRARMDEILKEKDIGPVEARKMEEIGVVLSNDVGNN